MKFLLAVCSLFFSCALGGEHLSSYPYLSGDTYRAFADHAIDENTTVKPQDVKQGDILFIKTDYLRSFFSYIYPRIQSPFVLITGNSDYTVPGPFSSFLEDSKLLGWYGMNTMGCKHPKMHPLPIGFANRCWDHGDLNVIRWSDQRHHMMPKVITLYMNFLIETHAYERAPLYEKFKDQPYCVARSRLSPAQYLQDLAASKFVLSPRGNGLDCHRTWEALVMGAIPVVITSDLDPLFADLPVLIIKSWDEITEEFLEAKWEEMREKEYRFEKLFADYWFEQFKSSSSLSIRSSHACTE